jgi:hypothetical protein
MSEILIYGLPKGEARPYMEELLSTKCKTQADVNHVLTLLNNQEGYHSFRVATYNGEAPDFTKTLTI